MKLIIDIPDKVYNEYREGVMSMENNCIIGNAVFDGIPYERPQGDSISREALKKALHNFFDGKVINEPAYILRDVFCHIDSAPAVKPCDNCDLYFKAMTKEENKPLNCFEPISTPIYDYMVGKGGAE